MHPPHRKSPPLKIPYQNLSRLQLFHADRLCRGKNNKITETKFDSKSNEEMMWAVVGKGRGIGKGIVLFVKTPRFWSDNRVGERARNSRLQCNNIRCFTR